MSTKDFIHNHSQEIADIADLQSRMATAESITNNVVQEINDTDPNNASTIPSTAAVVALASTIAGLNAQGYDTLAEWNAVTFTDAELQAGAIMAIVVDARTAQEVTDDEPVYSATFLAHYDETKQTQERHQINNEYMTPTEMMTAINALADVNFLSDAEKLKVTNAPVDTNLELYNTNANVLAVADTVGQHNTRLVALENAAGVSAIPPMPYGQVNMLWDGGEDEFDMNLYSSGVIGVSGGATLHFTHATDDFDYNYAINVDNTPNYEGPPTAYMTIEVDVFEGDGALFLKVRGHDRWGSTQVYAINPSTDLPDLLVGHRSANHKGLDSSSNYYNSVFSGPNRPAVTNPYWDWLMFPISAENVAAYSVNGKIKFAVNPFHDTTNWWLGGIAYAENPRGYTEINAYDIWTRAYDDIPGSLSHVSHTDNNDYGMSVLRYSGSGTQIYKLPILNENKDLIIGMTIYSSGTTAHPYIKCRISSEATSGAYLVYMDDSIPAFHDHHTHSLHQAYNVKIYVPAIEVQGYLKDGRLTMQLTIDGPTYALASYTNYEIYGIFTEYA